MFATDNDLVELLPKIFDHGISSFQEELDRAEAEVVRKIKIEWFNKVKSPSEFNKDLLTAEQWKQATMFRALGYYIMPRLSQWRPEGDSFREQSDFYQERFAEEMSDQFAAGIEYDLDESGTLGSSEYNQIQTRLYR